MTTGCSNQPFDEIDGIYARWDGRKVLCGADLDSSTSPDLGSIGAALDRARDRDQVLQLYAHRPGTTVAIDTIEMILDAADQRGIATLTYEDLAAGGPARPGLALSFDDNDVDSWWSMVDVLDAHAARVTFFVSRFSHLHDDDRQHLHELAERGHAIEAHTVNHLNAPEFVEEEGLAAYLDQEVLPSIDRLRDDGFDPHVFAYPFGARTPELDAAILEHVELIRSISFSSDYPLITDPCPE